MPAKPIDERELFARLSALFPEARVGALTPLPGGTSSITYWTTISHGNDAQKVVVKVAPAGLEPTRNRDVLRQARVLTALEAILPVPRVLGQDPGTPPEIPPFFVMSYEPGECIEPNTPGATIPPAHVRGRELHAAAIMARLHRTRPELVGLGDETPKTLAEEVEQWLNAFAACDEDLRAGAEDVGRALVDQLPRQGPTTLIHGDFRLGNTLAEADRVVAVIDWEIWARTDARIDLAWFLMMANPDSTLQRPIAEGMPSNEELLATYEGECGATIEDLAWFSALVRYKQAAAAAIIARNARRRGQDVPAARSNAALLASARRLLSID